VLPPSFVAITLPAALVSVKLGNIDIGLIFHGETTMRMMLKFTLPVESSNAKITDGSLGQTMESILSKLKPEAAYFTPLEGKRGGMVFFDMADPSQIVESVEPFFLSLNATTELVPVMNAEDLRKGLAKVARK